MFTHFQYKPLYSSESLPGWSFSFFFQNTYYRGTYHKDGHITWAETIPPQDSLTQITSHIHELMLFHVYE